MDKDLQIHVKNYKSFGPEWCGFEDVKQVNVLVGRNNTGKSSLLDVISFVVQPGNQLTGNVQQAARPEVLITSLLTAEDIPLAFSPNTSGGEIPGRNHQEYGNRWIGKPLARILPKGGQCDLMSVDPKPVPPALPLFARVAKNMKLPFDGRLCARLTSDRDIRPEADRTLGVLPTGEGATSTIKAYLTKAGLPTEKVETEMLQGLNEVFHPDATFKDITCQEVDNNEWEIYLGEETKGRIPLSKSGSGLKTVILVLANLILEPHRQKKELSQYVFALEELENNLHPALQRRLLLYLRRIAEKRDCVFFISTHSNVVIDLFSNDPLASITHVIHDGTLASATTATTYVEHKGILDDLDVRASDLLQSNGVVWVEGPSDRLYFNRFVELWTDGEIREGAHYQCVFYGGRLLAHLSGDDPTIDPDRLVKILRVNGNAILITDSDKRKARQPLNATKRRLRKEIEAVGGLFWVTQGREIENYLPADVFREYLNEPTLSALKPYGSIVDYLAKAKPGAGRRYQANKVMGAEGYLPLLSRSSLEGQLDLASRLTAAVKRIRAWNGIKE